MSTRDLAKILIPTIIGIIIITIIVVAIYFPPKGLLVCNLSSAPGDPHADYIYKVKFSNWKAKQLETQEVITTSNKKLLDSFEEQENKIKTKYKDLDFYKRTVEKESDKIISTTTINYETIDYDAIAKVEGVKEVQKKQIKIGKIKKMYQEIGAKCSYR